MVGVCMLGQLTWVHDVRHEWVGQSGAREAATQHTQTYSHSRCFARPITTVQLLSPAHPCLSMDAFTPAWTHRHTHMMFEAITALLSLPLVTSHRLSRSRITVTRNLRVHQEAHVRGTCIRQVSRTTRRGIIRCTCKWQVGNSGNGRACSWRVTALHMLSASVGVNERQIPAQAPMSTDHASCPTHSNHLTSLDHFPHSHMPLHPHLFSCSSTMLPEMLPMAQHSRLSGAQPSSRPFSCACWEQRRKGGGREGVQERHVGERHGTLPVSSDTC